MTASSLGLRLRRGWARLQRWARRAAAGVLIAGAWSAGWLLWIWAAGALLVFDDAPGQRSARAAAPAGEPAGRGAAGLEAPEPARAAAAYALDDLPRVVGRSLSCPELETVDFTGLSVELSPPARVALPFRERLIELERAVRDVSQRIYGRPPSEVFVAASHDCRPVSRNRSRLSEHALGNAIDITGFRFEADAATGAEAFEVRVARHWRATGDEPSEQHARFLEELTRALLARDVFRTLLGPSHPDHADHFHFDMAPQPFVNL